MVISLIEAAKRSAWSRAMVREAAMLQATITARPATSTIPIAAIKRRATECRRFIGRSSLVFPRSPRQRIYPDGRDISR